MRLEGRWQESLSQGCHSARLPAMGGGGHGCLPSAHSVVGGVTAACRPRAVSWGQGVSVACRPCATSRGQGSELPAVRAQCPGERASLTPLPSSTGPAGDPDVPRPWGPRGGTPTHLLYGGLQGHVQVVHPGQLHRLINALGGQRVSSENGVGVPVKQRWRESVLESKGMTDTERVLGPRPADAETDPAWPASRCSGRKMRPSQMFRVGAP